MLWIKCTFLESKSHPQTHFSTFLGTFHISQEECQVESGFIWLLKNLTWVLGPGKSLPSLTLLSFQPVKVHCYTLCTLRLKAIPLS